MNKGAGLRAALEEMGLSPHNVAAVGDAENDHAFLAVSECAVAVANALPMLKERADLVTSAANGSGVIELVDRLMADDLRDAEPFLTRHHVLLGTASDGGDVRLSPYDTTVLLAGPSGSGKSTVAIGLLERLAEQGYQFCLFDPEGDYETFDLAVALGDSQRPPRAEEVLDLLKRPSENAVVRLVGLPLADRPAFFAALLPRLLELRATTGRPHWIALDEAHHLLPAPADAADRNSLPDLGSMLLITVHPDHLPRSLLSAVDLLVAVGDAPRDTLGSFCQPLDLQPPSVDSASPDAGDVVAWFRRPESDPIRVRVTPSTMERRRHRRKYAEGEMDVDRSFYFRGPEGKLNLRAQNLALFSQIADGVDDDTWLYHLRNGDYARWFREMIKDDDLAKEAEWIQAQTSLSAAESRARINAAVYERYGPPA